MTHMINRDDRFQGDWIRYLSAGGSKTQVNYTNTASQRKIVNAVTAQSGNFVDPTPHAYVITKIEYPHGTRSQSGPAAGTQYLDVGWFNEYGYTLDDSQAPDETVVYNEALQRLYDQLRNSDADLSVDTAERHQAYRMIGNAWLKFKKLKGWARKAKRKQRYGMTVEEAKNAIGNAWLQYQYGWRPLLSTFYEVATFERSILSHRKLRARATRKNTWSVYRPAGGGIPNEQYTVQYSRRCEIGITYRVTNPLLFDLTRLTSLNPLAIAWELMPYSFVVDWFIDIGGYMQAMEQSLFLGLSFERGYVTRTSKQQVLGKYFGPYGRDWLGLPYQAELKYSTRQTSLARTPLLSPPRPYLPKPKLALGWQRMASAAALLNQILSPDPRLFRSRVMRGL